MFFYVSSSSFLLKSGFAIHKNAVNSVLLTLSFILGINKFIEQKLITNSEVLAQNFETWNAFPLRSSIIFHPKSVLIRLKRIKLKKLYRNFQKA